MEKRRGSLVKQRGNEEVETDAERMTSVERCEGEGGQEEMNRTDKRNWNGRFGRKRKRRETEESVDEGERAGGSWKIERETDG